MKKLNVKYRDKLSIITFSADAGEKIWREGLKRDNPEWLSLWDGKGNYSETMLKYNVTGYPTFCLIDPQGKILSKWTGYGKNDDGSGTVESIVVETINKQTFI